MGLTKKHFALFLVFCIVITVAIVAVSSSKETVPLQFFEDADLKHQAGSFNDAFHFSDFHQGWNNCTVWIRNVGAKSVVIGMAVTALPKDWLFTWDYDGRPIKSMEALKVTVSIYASFQPVSEIMFSVNLKYKTVE